MTLSPCSSCPYFPKCWYKCVPLCPAPSGLYTPVRSLTLFCHRVVPTTEGVPILLTHVLFKGPLPCSLSLRPAWTCHVGELCRYQKLLLGHERGRRSVLGDGYSPPAHPCFMAALVQSVGSEHRGCESLLPSSSNRQLGHNRAALVVCQSCVRKRNWGPSDGSGANVFLSLPENPRAR